MAPTKTASSVTLPAAGHWSFAERPAVRRVKVGKAGVVTHGTSAGWLCGCRCVPCESARPFVDGVEHGTVDGYSAGCRCDGCVLARDAAGAADEDRNDIARLAGDLIEILQDRLEPWRRRAACAGSTDVFFRETNGRIPAAADPRNVCRECPVAAECRDYISRRPSRHGVWAETVASERRAAVAAAA